MELKVNQDNCLGCGICVIACPVNAAISPENAGGNGAKTEEVIMMVENGFIKLFSPEKCELCGTCQMFCPVNAIWLEQGEILMHYANTYLEKPVVPDVKITGEGTTDVL